MSTPRIRRAGDQAQAGGRSVNMTHPTARERARTIAAEWQVNGVNAPVALATQIERAIIDAEQAAARETVDRMGKWERNTLPVDRGGLVRAKTQPTPPANKRSGAK